MKVRKAVIPAAGMGTRMLPAAKAIPKEMLPVVDRPTIQHVAEEAAEAGIEDILLITSPGKRAIEAHFERAVELEERLAAGGKSSLLETINELMRRVRFQSVHQNEQLGLGHAVLQAREHVGNEPFLCLLGDTIFSGAPSPSRQLVDAYERLGTCVIGLEEVSAEKVGRYGIIGGEQVEPGVWKLDALVEKPDVESAPSRLAIAARYVLKPDIFDAISKTPPGAGGEIQLTDALKHLLHGQPIYGVQLKGTRHDIGNPVDWLLTNVRLAAQNEVLWNRISPMLDALRG